MRTIPSLVADFVRQQEGCRLAAYEDAGGVWTIGVGHSSPDVKAGLTIDQAQADKLLAADLEVAAGRLAGVLNEPILVELTENQYAALLSFVFNLGCRPDWTIWKLLNAGRFDQVPVQLNRFVNVGGRKVQGLVNRRAAEAVLWSTEEPGSVAAPASSAVTRDVPTPPTPAPTPKAGLGAHLVGAASLVGAACTTYAPMAKSWADRLADFTGSPIVQHITVGLLTVAGVATLVGVISSELQRRAAKQ